MKSEISRVSWEGEFCGGWRLRAPHTYLHSHHLDKYPCLRDRATSPTDRNDLLTHIFEGTWNVRDIKSNPKVCLGVFVDCEWNICAWAYKYNLMQVQACACDEGCGETCVSMRMRMRIKFKSNEDEDALLYSLGWQSMAKRHCNRSLEEQHIYDFTCMLVLVIG